MAARTVVLFDAPDGEGQTRSVVPDPTSGTVILPGGTPGRPGTSAYAIAVAGGFAGTEEEWLASLRGPQGDQGVQGPQGVPGEDGSDGRPVQLSKTSTHVAWRYEGESTWIDLVALADLRGPQGEAGEDGASVALRVSGTHVQWRLDGDETWTDLVALDDLRGPVGPAGPEGPANTSSAVELFGKYAPPSGGYPMGLVVSYQGALWTPVFMSYMAPGSVPNGFLEMLTQQERSEVSSGIVPSDQLVGSDVSALYFQLPLGFEQNVVGFELVLPVGAVEVKLSIVPVYGPENVSPAVWESGWFATAEQLGADYRMLRAYGYPLSIPYVEYAIKIEARDADGNSALAGTPLLLNRTVTATVFGAPVPSGTGSYTTLVQDVNGTVSYVDSAAPVIVQVVAPMPAWRVVHPSVDLSGVTARLTEAEGKIVALEAGGIPVRDTESFVTSVLTDGGSETGVVVLGNGYRLYKIETSVPARVRLYASVAQRTADAGRAVSTAPAGDHGLMFEFVTTPSLLSAILSPLVDGAVLDSAGLSSGEVPISVTNVSGASSAVTVTLTYVRTE